MTEAWISLGWAQLLSGNPDGCIASNVTARRLNPLDETASIAWDNVPLACWETYRYGASVGAARRLLAARSDYW